MTDSDLVENYHFGRISSESHEEWISRITTYPQRDCGGEALKEIPTSSKNILSEIQDILSLGVTEERDENLECVNGEKVVHGRKETRSHKLMGFLPTLAQLWWLNSEQLDLAAEKLADGSRDPEWRIPLGESGIFNFFLEIFSRYVLRPTLKVHVLRLIGNSCADIDENRNRIAVSINYILPIIEQLKVDFVLPFALQVLLNICVDHTPNQLLASSAFLSRELLTLITDHKLDKSQQLLEHVCTLLTLLVSHASEIEFAPDYIAATLFKIVAENEPPVDLDNFTSLVNIATSYLQYEKFQKAFIGADKTLNRIISVLVDSYTRYDVQSSVSENDDSKALTNMRTALIQVLSDISALSEFKEACPISSQFSNTLQQWLVAPDPKLQLQVCACIMLGNLARSDAACIDIVQNFQLHKPLITIVSRENSSQILHAALSFLKNLAIPLENKKVIGEGGVFLVLSRVWIIDTIPQVQFTAISLGRQLTIGTLENVFRLIHDYSSNETENIFSRLCNLFTSTDYEPIKMEIARLSISIFRELYSKIEPCEITQSTRIRFFQMHPKINSQLSFVVSQTKWPAVRSEGWFVLALIARSTEGATFVSQLLEDSKFFELLSELVMQKNKINNLPLPTVSFSKDSATPSFFHLDPEPLKPHIQADEMAQLDRENALVLISEVLRNCDNELNVPQKIRYRTLLNGGGEILIDHRSKRDNVHQIV